MLTVIENEQQSPILYELDERLGDGSSGLFFHAEHGGDRLGNQTRIGDRRQFDEPHAVCIFIDDISGELHRQSRLPKAADAVQCDQA